MGIADVRDDADVGPDDSFEPFHFALFRDSGLDDGDLLVSGDHQQGQRNADL